MLQKLHLIDFQSHASTVLELDPGVNVFIGSSDSGKSAIIRGLEWAAYNSPTGYSFIRHGHKRAEVILSFDDGLVSRFRTKSVNGCEVNGVPLGALGVKVIPEVQAVTRMYDVNLQRQMDSPFLLSCNPPEVARRLNEVADLQDIDKAIKNVNAMCREDGQQVAVTEKLIVQLEADLEKFEGLDEIEELWKEYEKKATKKNKLQESMNRLAAGLNQYENIQDVIEAAPKLDLSGLDAPAAELEELEKELQKLQLTLHGYNRASGDMERASKKSQELKVEIKKIQPDVCPTCGGDWK